MTDRGQVSEDVDITGLLHRVCRGDAVAKAELVEALYGDLRRLAAAQLRGDRRDQTLRATVLVNEAYLKLLAGSKIQVNNRGHFFALAARAMRQVVVDYARAQLAEKRGGQAKVVRLEEAGALGRGEPAEILELHDALSRLEKKDPRAHRVVELRFFAGLSVEETADVLEISTRTVKREWSLGRAWLRGELAREAS